MVGSRKRYAFADTAQQILGGFLLAGPFVVTQEVWDVAATMSLMHAAATVCLVFGIGYGALYKADHDRDPDREADVAGIPTRFISLMLVSFGSVAILAIVFAAPETFLHDGLFDGHTSTDVLFTTAKAVSVGSVFSVVGAATADTVF
ncbi:hypothetical protein A4G99_00285 [Haladaptatus sp. R4]|uniref:hypothetical protein n=1 Tax=unclassified Haladaptatus TaxID=2622732 RepID=UPI0007B4B781|nr:hypothetical protein [Haladaptatus sp. R4]KZN25022.1 hypothetical protein A4G99_00285 [Haladaptatus sp. R4]